MEIKDSVGNILNDGDTIVLTKTLKFRLSFGLQKNRHNRQSGS